ncbi:MAG: deoxyribodipyrimidine photo-lyase [Opitutales bacterium]|nr:deoxyribodipyrimidine photo-lyase [Opitutales bacterium]
MNGATLLWFRQDLRLPDNAAYAAALERGGAVVPVYIHAPEEAGGWAPGGASRWWLHHALEDLAAALDGVGLRLVLRTGESLKTIRRLAKETGSDAVYWNRRYDPETTRRDAAVKEALTKGGLEAKSFNSSLLFEPWTVRSGQGRAYRVYTPFSRTVMAKGFAEPVETSGKRPAAPPKWPESMATGDLGLLPEIPWDAGIRGAWTPTRRGGLRRLNDFLDGPVRAYAEARDLPAEDGTSRLSPYLHFGQVGPREAVAKALRGNPGKGRETFVRELVWREFAYHVLYHFPDTPAEPLQDAFRRFPWRKDKEALRVWQRGRTGYPIVDAGMRQLWETGWMHNRVRMVVASFLVKHLLLPWQEGARWFWDTLVDADLASNTLGWQWAGGCGADAAPYFRIFNPMTQGAKFDGDGSYVRRFVPELANVPANYIHAPWEAPPDVLSRAGVRLGETYPKPIVDHKAARERALDALSKMKDAG